ncbi:hypothetical protein [Bradyrhizobium manausense]|uniref:hypothetical protein n=1 Tax=Bradyrhizobium manausense TaxID=989370 RepID=UPI000A8003BE|nr:hypothetical protein [Bradyrhizobium manausense]
MGRPVEVQPLPAASGEPTSQITIEPAKPRKSRSNKRIVEERQSAVDRNEPLTRTARHVKDHPIINNWIAERERQRREASASRNEWAIKNAPGPITEVDRRRYSLLSVLLNEIEAKGGRISTSPKGNLEARIEGETVEFQIREKQRQSRVTTSFAGRSFSKVELVGTGKLAFLVLTYWPGHHSTEWRETNSVVLDSRLPEMVARIFEGAKALKAWHLQRQTEEEQRRKAAAERVERQRQAEIEGKYRQKLIELATDWQTATIVRDLVAVLRSNEGVQNQDVSGKSVAEWLAWADQVANDLDATRNGAAAFFSMIKPQSS